MSEEHITRQYCFSHMVDALTDAEKLRYPSVKKVLQAKIEDGEITINIQSLMKYCNPLSEVLCRRLINKFEYENEKITFIITNGSENWSRFDALRHAKVQADAESQAQ